MSAALATLQRNFSRYVLSGDAAALRPNVRGSAAADADRRLDVYAQAYRLRLLEVLGNELPGLRALAGDARFEQLCRDYIESTPSPHYNVRWYGDRLADFLREAASTEPALAEMAALEWCLTLAFDAADDAVIAAADLAALTPGDWPGLRFVLHGSLQRLSLQYNVNEIRRAIDREETSPPLRQFDRTETWIAWRKQHDVRHRCLEIDEAIALDALARGASFAEVCESLCASHAADGVALRAATLLQRWIEDHWISGLRLDDGDAIEAAASDPAVTLGTLDYPAQAAAGLGN